MLKINDEVYFATESASCCIVMYKIYRINKVETESGSYIVYDLNPKYEEFIKTYCGEKTLKLFKSVPGFKYSWIEESKQTYGLCNLSFREEELGIRFFKTELEAVKYTLDNFVNLLKTKYNYEIDFKINKKEGVQNDKRIV